MSIKTSKRIALGVIASLVFAPFAAIAPASASSVASDVASITATRTAADLSVNVTQSIDAAITFATIADDLDFTFRATVIEQPGTSPVTVSATTAGATVADPDGATGTEFTVARTNGQVASVALDGSGTPSSDTYDSDTITERFAFTPALAGTYTLRIWHDVNLDSAQSGTEKFVDITFTITQAPGTINRAIQVFSITGAPTAAVRLGTGAQTLTVNGVASASGIGIGDTITYTASLTKPTLSAVTLSDKTGATGGTMYGTTSATGFGTAALSQTNSRVTLTKTGSATSPFADVDLGDFSFTPDVVGTYTLVISSTDASGAATGTPVSVSIEVTAADTSLGLDAGDFGLKDRGTGVDGTPAAANLSTANTGVYFVDTLHTKSPATIDKAEVFYSAATEDNFELNVLAGAVTTASRYLTFTISGPATWDFGQVVTTYSADNKVITVNEGGRAVPDVLTFTLTGAGDVTITVRDVLGSTGVATAIGSYVVHSVTTSLVGIYSATDSSSQLQITPVGLTEIPDPEIDVVGANVRPNTGTAYLALYLRDVYDGPVAVAATRALVANATNGALVGWGAIPITSTAIETSNLSTPILWIRQGTATTTTVEVKLNDTVVATRTVSWTGAASSIAISAKKASVAVGATTADAFKYAISDSSGNRIASSATVTKVDGVYVTAATASAGSATTASGVSVTCSALLGKGSVTLTYATTKTEVVEITCAGGIASFEVSTNKTAYERAEIGVFTITAKDSAGQPVADGTALATAAAKLQFTGSGATFAKTPAAADVLNNGKIDYAFTTSATAGSYNFAVWHGDLSPAVTKIASFAVNAAPVPPVVVPPVAPTLTGSLNGRVLLFGSCQADEGDLIIYVKSPGDAWKERAKTFECAAGEFDGSIRAPKSTKFYRVKQEGTGLWSSSVLIRR